MILEAFAALFTGPVHEESIAGVEHENRDDHVDHHAECGDAAEESENQSEPAKEFGGDGEECEHRRNALVFEEAHGGAEAVAAPPAKHLLRSVRKHH